MKHLGLILLFWVSAVHAKPTTLSASLNVTATVDPELCAIETSSHSQLRAADFKWFYTLETMAETFSKIYSDTVKRLPKRMFWDAQKKSFYLPYMADRGGDVKVADSFIENLKSHIVSAYEEKYIDHVFFPDMGHSHFLIPEAAWDKIYNPMPVSEFSRMYEKMFADKQLKILYHTAEQLQTLDDQDQVLPDPQLQWRFKTRNIVGSNNGQKKLLVLQNPNSKANTVGEYKGHFWWGAGYNISANQQGCISLKKPNGEELRFDISLYDLE